MLPDYALRFALACSFLARGTEGMDFQRGLLETTLPGFLSGQDIVRAASLHVVNATCLRLLMSADHGMEGDVLEELKAHAREMSRAALALAWVERSAMGTLERAGFEVRRLKGGPDLSRRLYGDVGLRLCKDIDLIVPQDQFFEANETLAKSGWSSSLPPFWGDRWHRRLGVELMQDVALLDARHGSELELHGRFERLPDKNLDSRWWELFRSAPAPENGVSDPEFLYMVLHGCGHGWEVARWLGDLLAALDRDPGLPARCALHLRELKMERHAAATARLLAELGGRHPFLEPLRIWEDPTVAHVRLARTFHLELSYEEHAPLLPRTVFQLWLRHALERGRHDWMTRTAYGIVHVLYHRLDMEALGGSPVWVLLYPIMRPFKVVGRILMGFKPSHRESSVPAV